MLGNLRHFVGNVLGARWWGGGGGGRGGRGVHYIKKKTKTKTKKRKRKQIDCIIPEALDQVYQSINETLLGVFRIPDIWVAIERIH